MRKLAALGATVALFGGLTAVASPAQALCLVTDPTCTNVTFTVNAGVLSLTAPTSASGTSTLSGGVAVVDMSLGNTVVNDSRTTSTGWTVSATATNFTSGVTSTIAKTAASFSVPGTPTAPTGVTGIATCSTFTKKSTATAVDANGTTAAIIACSQAGASGLTYAPSLLITLPANVAAGTYTGTVTQSVA